MKKKELLFKIHSLEENRKELLLVLKNTQLDLNDYIVESKKRNNTVTQQQKLIYEQKELIDELLKNKSTSDSKQKLIECLTSSLIEELDKNKSLKEGSNYDSLIEEYIFQLKNQINQNRNQNARSF
jgi:predicted transcriptional regulator